MKVIFIIFITLLCVINLSFSQDMSSVGGKKVTATVYNAVESQCNNDPSHTAFMFKLDLDNPYKHRIIAISRDLLIEYPKGTRVKITGTSYDGEYTVMDKMNKRWTNRIDILINTDMSIGKWDNARILKLN